MRVLLWALLCFALTAQAAPKDKDTDDAQLKLDPASPNPLHLIYDTALNRSTVFCAATPPKQLLAITVSCNGNPVCNNNEYTLAGSDGATVPITLTFTDNHGSNKVLQPNIREEGLPSQGANCGKGNSEDDRTIHVAVNKHDIDWTKAPFERTFTITAENIEKNRRDTEEFTVKFGEDGLIRISGLQDLALTKENNWQAKNEQVCVASSTLTYRLTAESANSGELKNNASGIPYTLQYKEHNSALWQDITFGNNYPTLTASRTEACTDGTYLGVQAVVQEGDLSTAPTGGYSDTVTLIVEAE